MTSEDRTTIIVQVQPNAGQNRVVRHDDGVWHLRIAAPPTKGKANQELLSFLSDILGEGKSRLAIEGGLTARRKVISIQGLKQELVTEKLARQVR